jgi:dTDP-4-dehydrorhamnose reductase/dTDP-4-dehydrorhamnose 3,5-epimerase
MEPVIETTPIPGLVVLRLPVHEDARGWFKENWHRAKMTALGLPDFGPVQNNVSFNVRRGVTRGIHAEPWDKLVSVTTGRVFAAWVDLREGSTFGTTFHTQVDPGVAVFVPRGVGNSYQTLDDATSYSYLVNDHWSPGTAYPAVDLDDPSAAIPWPIPLESAEISEKDRANPALAEVMPVPPLRTLILGANGQLGRALHRVFPDADTADLAGAALTLDLTDAAAVAQWPWHEYSLVLNAAAYTAVDAAETQEGRRVSWAANAVAPATLARLAEQHRFVLVHYSTDYVFDGTAEDHSEVEPLSPLGVYGQSKAAGDIAVTGAPAHYVLRTSWVVGDGRNFVRTMQQLAQNGTSPSVVADQFGRLTFTDELARATRHLVANHAPYGVYNVTNAGPVTSWADVARAIFVLSDRDPDDVTSVTSDEYTAGKLVSPRPVHSTLRLDKLAAAGFEPEDALAALRRYCSSGQRP